VIQRDFSPPAFGVRWIEDSGLRVQFDMTRCYYLGTLTTLGIPELTGLYCHGDEVMYGGLNHLRFVRAGTLAQ
jgi:L-2-amino-thiazoline-4-carboxylic acid hydrolase